MVRAVGASSRNASFWYRKNNSYCASCVRKKKSSEESVKNITSLANEKNIPKMLVEFAVVSQIGKIFCESTYALEGDDPFGASF